MSVDGTRPTWLSVFLDLPGDAFGTTADFWAAVSGTTVSPPRGAHDEFATLLPRDGDDHLRVQRLGDGPARLHLDLHTPDPRGTADAAVALGAEELAHPGHVLLRSPGGLVFCCVSRPASRMPSVRAWPGGHRSRVDQVCLDMPRTSWETEPAFWSAFLGTPVQDPFPRDEFCRIDVPGIGMRVLLQRLEEEDGPVRAHLDLAASDRAVETARHVALGAHAEQRHEWWTVLRDPAGLPYCITDRDPDAPPRAQ